MEKLLIICSILFCVCITPKETYIGNAFDDNPIIEEKVYKSDYIDTDDKLDYEQEEIISRGNYVRNTTEYERELLAKLLWTEARGESIECQRAVVSVVLNRVESGYWGNSIESVIKAKGQFDLGNKLNNIKPNKIQYEVVDYVLENGSTLPKEVIYFRANYYHKWAKDYCKIDNTYFSSKK